MHMGTVEKHWVIICSVPFNYCNMTSMFQKLHRTYTEWSHIVLLTLTILILFYSVTHSISRDSEAQVSIYTQSHLRTLRLLKHTFYLVILQWILTFNFTYMITNAYQARCWVSHLLNYIFFTYHFILHEPWILKCIPTKFIIKFITIKKYDFFTYIYISEQIFFD